MDRTGGLNPHSLPCGIAETHLRDGLNVVAPADQEQLVRKHNALFEIHGQSALAEAAVPRFVVAALALVSFGLKRRPGVRRVAGASSTSRYSARNRSTSRGWAALAACGSNSTVTPSAIC